MYSHVHFGPRTVVDSSCQFEEGVRVGPDSSLFSVRVGRHTFFAFRDWAGHASVGPFCSIGPNVIVGMGRHPARAYVSSHPAFYSGAWPGKRYARAEFIEHQPVSIGPDVWVGANAFIAPGVTVGPGAIVGAGAVVVSNVAPYQIVGGVPSRVLRPRFDEGDVAFLLSVRWWEWPENVIVAHAPYFDDVTRLRRHLEQAGPI
jgi:acetyltransferase-like isoleucine patch superfamily enzyme